MVMNEMGKLDIQKITKNMTIGSILEKYPEHAFKLSEVMAAAGLHCVGCGAATFETLEQGVQVHGFDNSVLNNLIVDLNAVLNQKDSSKLFESVVCNLTTRAAEKVKEIMNKNKKQKCFLRVGILSGGCAGYSYDLGIEDKKRSSDVCFEQEGIQILVNKECVPILKDVEIDYVEGLNENGFKFNNPNASNGCGCGKSFS
jgi:iron-sulfur cluster assembly accessory protein